MSTGRKWQDSKDKKMKSGQWTEKELTHLKKLLCKYAYRKGLSPEQLSSLCSDTTPIGFEGVWTKLAEFFPSRSVQSVHNAVKRHFNPNNYKGQWTIDEERQLIEFVKANGQKWKELGELLQRTSSNVKDKWKQMGGAHNELRKRGSWSSVETKELVLLVFKLLGIGTGEVEGVPVDNEDICVNQLLAIIRKFRDRLDEEEISWNAIGDVFKTRSSVDCRTRWNYIIHTKIPENKVFSEADDMNLFEAIKSQGASRIEKIDFSMINNGKNEEDNKFRFKVLSKAMSGRLKLSLNEIISKLESSYGQSSTKLDPGILEFYSNYKNS